MSRKPSKIEIAGGADPLAAAAIAAAIAQQLADEEAAAAKPKEALTRSTWIQRASEEPTYSPPKHPNR